MSLIWNKIQVDNTKDRFFKFQNKSLIPDSKVWVVISNTEPTEPTGLVIVSRQFLNQVVLTGESVWYAEETGGVFTYSSTLLPKLENYNIPTVHENIAITDTPVTINVPEGGTITFQNLSKSNIGARIGSETNGAFILSQYQIFAESFPTNNSVTFYPDVTGATGLATYSITQSAIVTQLSPSAQAELDKMKAAVELMLEQAVTKDELESIEARLYHNNWSLPNFIQRSNTKLLMSYPFRGNTAIYHSRGVQDNSGFSVLFDINATFENDKGELVSERGLVFGQGIYKNSGSGSFMVSRSNNVEISKLIEQVNINVSQNRNELSIGLSLSKNVITAGLSTIIKFEHNYFETFQGEATNVEYITSYKVDLINAGINFSDTIIQTMAKILDKATSSKQKVVAICSSLDTATEDNQGHLSEVNIVNLDESQYVKLVVSDENKIELRSKIKGEKLSNLFKVLSVIRCFNETEFKFTANTTIVGCFKSESSVDGYKTSVVDIENTNNDTVLIELFKSITPGDTVELEFRKEVL
ncbi:MAG: hypothetical protein ACRCX8_12715 [Sarcina sp.]